MQPSVCKAEADRKLSYQVIIKKQTAIQYAYMKKTEATKSPPESR